MGTSCMRNPDACRHELPFWRRSQGTEREKGTALSEQQAFRPRFGVLYRHDGDRRTVVFYPHESLPDTFVCHYADTEEVAIVDAKAGDRIQVDNLAPGQAIYINYPDQPGPVRGRLQS